MALNNFYFFTFRDWEDYDYNYNDPYEDYNYNYGQSRTKRANKVKHKIETKPTMNVVARPANGIKQETNYVSATDSEVNDILGIATKTMTPGTQFIYFYR